MPKRHSDAPSTSDRLARGAAKGGGAGAPLWARVRKKLEREITSGALAVADKLPGENALADRFGVHRHTIRRALAALEGDGVIRIDRGRCSVVNREVIEYRIGRRTRFSENVKRLGFEAGGTLLDSKVVPAPQAVASALSIQPLTKVISFTTLRSVEGSPIVLSSHYLPFSTFSGIDEAYRGSLSEALSQFGIADYVRLRTTVATRLPDEGEAKQLQLTPFLPIFEVCGVDGTVDGVPFHICFTRMPGLRVQLSLE